SWALIRLVVTSWYRRASHAVSVNMRAQNCPKKSAGALSPTAARNFLYSAGSSEGSSGGDPMNDTSSSLSPSLRMWVFNSQFDRFVFGIGIGHVILLVLRACESSFASIESASAIIFDTMQDHVSTLMTYDGVWCRHCRDRGCRLG